MTGEQQEVVITLQSGEQLRWCLAISDDELILGRADLGIEYHLSGALREQLLKPPQPEKREL